MAAVQGEAAKGGGSAAVAADLKSCVERERRAIRKALAAATKDPRTGVLSEESAERLTRVLDRAQADIERHSGLGADTPARSTLLEGRADGELLAETMKTLSIIESLRDHVRAPSDAARETQIPSAASLGASIAGSPRLKPGHVLRAMRASGADALVGLINSRLIGQITFAPVAEYRGSAVVSQRSKDGYQVHPDLLETRRLAAEISSSHFLAGIPIVLSGRGRWVWSPLPTDDQEGLVLTYDSAAIVDGRVRVGAMSLGAAERGVEFEVPFVLFPSLDLRAERRMYDAVHSSGDGDPREAGDRAPIRKPSQAPPNRLVVGVEPVKLEITSEPYVVLGPYGYSPFVDVVSIETGSEQGLYVSARTLADQLEELRPPGGSLVGLRLRIWKEDEGRTAAYVVERL